MGISKKGIVKSSILTWRLNEEITGSIKLRADNLSNNCHIEMEYKIDGIDKTNRFYCFKNLTLRRSNYVF